MLTGAIQARPRRGPTLLRWVQPLGEAGVSIYIGGVAAMDLVDLDTLTKDETDSAVTSNTLSFTCWRDNPPTPGQEIIVYRGSTLEREFAGVVLDVEDFYDEIRHNVGWRMKCQDYTWEFNDERFSMKWSGAVSGSTIAVAIVALKAGFTSTNVEAGLPDVTDFEIINKTRGEGLKLLAEHVGAVVCKVDYDRDVHFRITPTAVNLPADITDITRSGDRLTRSQLLSQARTRQRGLGVRVRIPVFLPAGSTTLPVEAVERLPAAGSLQIGSTLVTWTAQTQAQAASGIADTAAAPTVALASSPAGGVLGAVRYAVTFETPNGETPLGAQSAEVTGATLAAPSAGAAAAQHTDTVIGTSGSPIDYYSVSVTMTRSGTTLSFTMSGAVVGARVYIFASATGAYDGIHTISSVSGTTVSIAGVSSSGPASETALVQWITAGPLIGTFNYKFGWISPRGISALSSAFSATVAAPGSSAWSVAATFGQTTGGALTTLSTYYYFYTVLMDGAETAPVVLGSQALTGANNAVTLTFSALSNWIDLRVRGFRVYRGRAGQQIPRVLVEYSRESLRANDGFASSFVYTDTTADPALGGLPMASVFGAAIGISGLPSWVDGRVTGLALLRTTVGGSTYYLHSIINSSTVTSIIDTMPDDELLRQSPVPTTSFGGHSVTLTNIATLVGATARNIYRLFNGVWRYCGTITNNVDTAFTDKKADDELGAPFKVGGFLTGISATGRDIVAGEVGRLHVLQDDAAAQTALANLLDNGHDGIVEGPVLDDEQLEQTPLAAACDAEIAVFKSVLEATGFISRDVNFNQGPGKTITFNIGDIAGTFIIQKVTTSEYGRANDLEPLREVTAGPVALTLRNALAA